ncbi:hypothetical protein [Frigoriflavimonas asaccharolytica]|uniref:Uncharacterized protein n=1 Tax=Frigoriflavimonas asaccharolytica TaxID=2735899 RepID=A0A8J8GAR6_9FLAO|nr:hypothetical protein [Frigoriflavimonas asaccharolytica]NRS94163.1 hypothetical protein [Frigoriflavimonas asaccharolytica]
MKKFILVSATMLLITAVSCRQTDDVLSTEDIATIKVIESNRNNESSDSNYTMKSDSIQYNEFTTQTFDGEIQSPPRK